MARDFSGHGTGSYLPKAAQDHAEHTGCYCQTWHGIVIVAKCGPRSFAKHTGSYCQTRYGIVIIAKCGPRSCRTHRILLPNKVRDRNYCQMRPKILPNTPDLTAKHGTGSCQTHTKSYSKHRMGYSSWQMRHHLFLLLPRPTGSCRTW